MSINKYKCYSLIKYSALPWGNEDIVETNHENDIFSIIVYAVMELKIEILATKRNFNSHLILPTTYKQYAVDVFNYL